MFENYTVKVLRQLLKQLTHDITGYAKMTKSKLVEEMNKRFVIQDGHVFPIVEGSGNAKAGYVQRMEAERKIQFPKITNPSKYMIDKYGNNQPVAMEPVFEPLPYEEGPLFADHETTHFNVGKQKPKKKKKTKTPTEAQEEREERERQEELQRKQDLLENLESLKRQVVECNKKLQKEKNTYHAVIEDVQKNRERLKKAQKEEKVQQVIAKHRSNIQKIKDGYEELFQFIKDNGLNEDDLNEVHKFIRTHINKL
jgi:hypothetical protein